MVCRDLDLLMESRIYLTYKMTNSPHDQNGEPSLVEASPQLSEEPLKIESLCMRCSENVILFDILSKISNPPLGNNDAFSNFDSPFQKCDDHGI